MVPLTGRVLVMIRIGIRALRVWYCDPTSDTPKKIPTNSGTRNAGSDQVPRVSQDTPKNGRNDAPSACGIAHQSNGASGAGGSLDSKVSSPMARPTAATT